MDFPSNPSAKFPHRDGLGSLVLEDGSGVPMMREAFLQGSALVVRLLCAQPHINRYVAFVKMRHWMSRPAVFETFSSFEYHITREATRSVSEWRRAGRCGRRLLAWWHRLSKPIGHALPQVEYVRAVRDRVPFTFVPYKLCALVLPQQRSEELFVLLNRNKVEIAVNQHQWRLDLARTQHRASGAIKIGIDPRWVVEAAGAFFRLQHSQHLSFLRRPCVEIGRA